jgi:hypothetical protein
MLTGRHTHHSVRTTGPMPQRANSTVYEKPKPAEGAVHRSGLSAGLQAVTLSPPTSFVLVSELNTQAVYPHVGWGGGAGTGCCRSEEAEGLAVCVCAPVCVGWPSPSPKLTSHLHSIQTQSVLNEPSFPISPMKTLKGSCKIPVL